MRRRCCHEALTTRIDSGPAAGLSWRRSCSPCNSAGAGPGRPRAGHRSALPRRHRRRGRQAGHPHRRPARAGRSRGLGTPPVGAQHRERRLLDRALDRAQLRLGGPGLLDSQGDLQGAVRQEQELPRGVLRPRRHLPAAATRRRDPEQRPERLLRLQRQGRDLPPPPGGRPLGNRGPRALPLRAGRARAGGSPAVVPLAAPGPHPRVRAERPGRGRRADHERGSAPARRRTPGDGPPEGDRHQSGGGRASGPS